MTVLIGSKKLKVDEALDLISTGLYSLSKIVCEKPSWKRDVSTGEVISLEPKVVTDYIIHLKESNKLNRKHITKSASLKVIKTLGIKLEDVPEIEDY